ncbi:Hint domain-containing protein [Rhodobacter sp. CZR27]|uniref:Hint domain-containing protein n=1 Tax=Rhodobacter sp. CZR27 TaxID=2033869 RepID=UPI000BBE0A51|nr:Hint domain-containing protein [Rhodobacter sp. CZR27]
MNATTRSRPASRLLHLVRLEAGAEVLTLRGVVAAGSLAAGDRLVGRSGAIRLVRIETFVLRDVEMLRIGAGTMAHGQPGAPVLLPPDQPLRLSGERADLVYRRDPVTVPAVRIADGRLNRIVRIAEIRLVTLGFDSPAAIYAGALQCVTLPEVTPAHG